MATCQECGSEVAENDIFCPFCGISLRPINVPGPSEEIAFDSTIVMSDNQLLPDAPHGSTNDEIDSPSDAPDIEEPSSLSEPASPDMQETLLQSSQEPGAESEPIEENLIDDPAGDGSISASLDSGSTGSEMADESEESAAVINDIEPAPAAEEHDPTEDEGSEEDHESDSESAIGSPDTDLPVDAQQQELTPDKIETGDDESQSIQENLANTSSGEIADESDAGHTSPNFSGSGTDGRKSGLKPLSEGVILNNRYEIVRKIGGGGMGAVYLANDMNLGGTQRAVKEMVQSHIEESQQTKAIEDFKRESMILSTLDHPSIPTIYDYFYDEHECRFYLVMKYISGGDLASRLRAAPEGRIDEQTVTQWALQVVDVLHYLHSLPATIVYRDLKPSNIMIDGNSDRIMLIDFGIARSINQAQEKGVTAVGTMGYAPPELFSGQVEPRSDIYSLGSTMFHLLTGADPQNNPLLIFDFQKNPRPRQINPRLSDQMERILMRAVEYNADQRFASALEMKHVLREHLDNLQAGNVSYGISETPAAVSLANQNVFCGFCGQRIVATDLFCAFCGSKQPLAQQGVHSEIYSRPATTTARLVVDGTTELQAPAFSLEKSENLVGRRDPMSNIFPEVDLSKYDPQTKISRRHARIWREGSSFMVEDLGSSNGTLLFSNVSDNLRLAPHKPHPLSNGDRLKLGDTTLQFIVS